MELVEMKVTKKDLEKYTTILYILLYGYNAPRVGKTKEYYAGIVEFPTKKVPAWISITNVGTAKNKAYEIRANHYDSGTEDVCLNHHFLISIVNDKSLRKGFEFLPIVEQVVQTIVNRKKIIVPFRYKALPVLLRRTAKLGLNRKQANKINQNSNVFIHIKPLITLDIVDDWYNKNTSYLVKITMYPDSLDPVCLIFVWETRTTGLVESDFISYLVESNFISYAETVSKEEGKISVSDAIFQFYEITGIKDR